MQNPYCVKGVTTHYMYVLLIVAVPGSRVVLLHMIHNPDALHRRQRLIDVDAIYNITTARHQGFARMRVVMCSAMRPPRPLLAFAQAAPAVEKLSSCLRFLLSLASVFQLLTLPPYEVIYLQVQKHCEDGLTFLAPAVRKLLRRTE